MPAEVLRSADGRTYETRRQERANNESITYMDDLESTLGVYGAIRW